ncbi:MAG TPA: beta-propeller domain-containing protein, partial [Jiangellaceae bacterium]|nr:beta-propeller domain-containing protein [Jiangellaceae bacterium]
MRTTGARATVLVAGLAGSAMALSACTGGGTGGVQPPAGQLAAALRLVSFDSCDDALAAFKRAAARYVSPYGLGGGQILEADAALGVPEAATADEGGALSAGSADAGAGVTAQRGYSTTNTHEIGVDEPDLVKTDGRRIVTVTGDTLHVIDAESRTLTGELELDDRHGDVWYSEQMLLSGDHALVIGYGMVDVARSGVESFADVEMSYVPEGTRLVLVDLSGDPEIVGTMDLDGAFVDARQVGSTVRMIVRSGPRIDWTYAQWSPTETALHEAEALAANRQLLGRSTIEDWLPRFVATDDAGERSDGLLVECEDVSHPQEYLGTSMLTVVTLDLTGDLSPEGSVTVVADGQTVYGTGDSLYIAGYHGGSPMPFKLTAAGPLPVADPGTEIHKFDVSEPGSPQYVASGRVDGSLLNQYSLSEYDGHLRVATTTDPWTDGVPPDDGGVAPSESGVSVLAQQGDRLVEVGSVGGLGKGERIYAVRFLGPVGYVVTFRQVDPLYTLDLTDPASPHVVGELKIPGYSAYLHPVDDDRLLGVGQNADEQGMTLGAQVSLFDVCDPAEPSRLDTYTLPGGWSDAEYDPHAFLYWPTDGLVVIPVWAQPTPLGEPGAVP